MGATYGQLVAEATDRLKEANIDDASYDAFALFEYVSGINKARYLMIKGDEADQAVAVKYEQLVDRRQNHEPLQYITGSQWFYGLEYYVDSRVLIPRQDTEVVVDYILSREKEHNQDVLDICTGSGCIALTLAANRAGWNVTGSDISMDALEVSAINMDRLKINNVCFKKSDMLQNVDGEYDIIVSNPPYIERHVIDELTSEVRDYEPMLALSGGEDGLDFYRIIVRDAREHLKQAGRLYFEIGYNQGQAVVDLLRECGYTDIQVRQDLAGKDRMVCGSFIKPER